MQNYRTETVTTSEGWIWLNIYDLATGTLVHRTVRRRDGRGAERQAIAEALAWIDNKEKLDTAAA